MDDRLQKIASWAANGGELDQKLKIERFTTGGFILKDRVNGIEPQHEAFDALKAYLEAWESRSAEAHFRMVHLIHAASWIRHQFNTIKNTRALVDQNDLIAKLHHSLTETGGESLAAVIRNQYPVALIDEFQDTDPQQYEIFKRIYGRAIEQEAWLMVGDPKQSIYGFRGADIYAYLDARSQEGVTRHTLGTNYRSTSALVDAVNQIFQYGESHPHGAFNFKRPKGKDHAIPFDPVKSVGRSERLFRDGRPIKSLKIWYYPNGGEIIALEPYRKVMAEIAANEIAALLNAARFGDAGEAASVFFEEQDSHKRRPLKPSDIAILVQDRHDARAIRDALFLRNLRSVYLSDNDSVLQTQEAQDIVLWLEAFLAPRNGRRIRSAMATPTLSLSFKQLEALSLDDLVLDETITRFVGYAQIWHEKGILPAIRQFMLDQNLPARLIQTAEGERSLTNLLHLTELLQTESTQVDGENGLLRYFKESIGESGTEDENILRLESDSALIRVITIHKSKGLQYPLVFLPFIASARPIAKDRHLYAYHDDQLALNLSLEPGDPSNPDSPIQRCDEERLQESLRLFYVALTRAEHACWLGVAPFRHGKDKGPERESEDDPKVTGLHRGALGYLIAGGAPMTPDDVLPGMERMIGKQTDTEILVVEPPERIAFTGSNTPVLAEAQLETFTGEPFEPWSIDSYSHLVRQLEQMKGGFRKTPGPIETGADDRDDEVDESDGPNPPALPTLNFHAFPAGKVHGDYLHKLLEAIGNEGFDRVARDPDIRRVILVASLKTQSYDDAWVDPLEAWLDTFLHTAFQLEKTPFAFDTLSLEDTRVEMEFWFEVNHANLRSIDDLVSQYVLEGQKRPQLKSGMLNGMLKGFIDLTFRIGGRYYVADYKSNRLGSMDVHYTQEALESAVLEHRYDLQYAIYLLALHRYLKSRLGVRYDYDQRIGGVAYFFLRGINGPTHGLHFIKPKREMIEALDRLFDGHPLKETDHAT